MDYNAIFTRLIVRENFIAEVGSSFNNCHEISINLPHLLPDDPRVDKEG
jgi:hypothetical protein